MEIAHKMKIQNKTKHNDLCDAHPAPSGQTVGLGRDSFLFFIAVHMRTMRQLDRQWASRPRLSSFSVGVLMKRIMRHYDGQWDSGTLRCGGRLCFVGPIAHAAPWPLPVAGSAARVVCFFCFYRRPLVRPARLRTDSGHLCAVTRHINAFVLTVHDGRSPPLGATAWFFMVLFWFWDSYHPSV